MGSSVVGNAHGSQRSHTALKSKILLLLDFDDNPTSSINMSLNEDRYVSKHINQDVKNNLCHGSSLILLPFLDPLILGRVSFTDMWLIHLYTKCQFNSIIIYYNFLTFDFEFSLYIGPKNYVADPISKVDMDPYECTETMASVAYFLLLCLQF